MLESREFKLEIHPVVELTNKLKYKLLLNPFAASLNPASLKLAPGSIDTTLEIDQDT